MLFQRSVTMSIVSGFDKLPLRSLDLAPSIEPGCSYA